MALNVGSLNAELSLDITPFNLSVEKATAGIQQMGQQMQTALNTGVAQSFTTINRRLGSLMKRMDEVGQSSLKMQDSITNAVSSSISVFQELNAQIDTTKRNFIDFGGEGVEAVLHIDTAAKDISATVRQVGADTRSATETIRNAYSDMNMDAQTSGMDSIKASAAAAKLEVGQTAVNMKKTADETKKLTQKLSKADKAAKSLQKNTYNMARDLKRITGGIILSQAFYRSINAIKDGVSAVVEFSANMEMAAISFEYLLGSAERADGFISVMKEFAAYTPFTTEQSMDMSKRLMAMGFEGTQVLDIMTTITDAAAATSKDAADMDDRLDRIVLALGQMKTNGRVMGRELRQLAKVGIPVYTILQEQLDLTEAQMRNIGNMEISGDIGVRAILDGLKLYEGAADQFAYTLVGLKNTISDTSKMVSEELFKTPYQAYKTFLLNLRNFLVDVRTVLGETGIGGVFEHVVPESLHQSVRAIIEAFNTLGRAVKDVFAVIGPIIGDAMNMIVRSLGMVLPPIAIFIKKITGLVRAAMEASPLLRLLAQVIIGLAVAGTVAKIVMALVTAIKALNIAALVAGAIQTLTKAITVLYVAATAHPIVAVLTLIAAGLLAIALSSKTVVAWLDQVSARLAGIAGFDTSKVFAPDPDANNDLQRWLEEFGQAFDPVEDGLDNVEDKAGKAGKGIKKFLAAFDEVFGIPEALDDVGDAFKGISAPNLNIPDLPDIGIPAIDIPAMDWDKDKKWGIDWDIPPIPPPPPFTGWPIGPLFEPIPDPVWEPNWGLEGLPKWIPHPYFEPVPRPIWEPDWGLDHVPEWIPHPVFGPLPNPVWNPNWGLDGLPEWIPHPAIDGLPNPVWNPNWGLDGLPEWIPHPAIDGLPNPVWSPNWGLDTLPKLIPAPIFGPIPTPIYNPNWNLEPPHIPSIIFPPIIATAYEQSLEALRQFTEGFLGGLQTASELGVTGLMTAVVGILATKFGEVQKAQEGLHTGLSKALETFGKDYEGSLAGILGEWLSSYETHKGAMETEQGLLHTAMAAALATWGLASNTSLQGIFGTFEASMETHKTNAATLGAAIMAAFGTNFVSNLNIAGQNLVLGIENMQTNLNAWGRSAAETAFEAGKGIAANLGAGLEAAAGSFGSFMSVMQRNMAGLGRGLLRQTADIATGMVTNMVNGFRTIWDNFKNMMSSLGERISGWFRDNKQFVKTTAIVAGTVAAIGLTALVAPYAIPYVAPAMAKLGTIGAGLAFGGAFEKGGIVDKDQLIRVGEGNKREAIIPIQDLSYMAPFADAVADRIAGRGDTSSKEGKDTRPILYVHTLIADDAGLRELNRQMRVIDMGEAERRGEEWDTALSR